MARLKSWQIFPRFRISPNRMPIIARPFPPGEATLKRLTKRSAHRLPFAVSLLVAAATAAIPLQRRGNSRLLDRERTTVCSSGRWTCRSP
jgi:hypothetical protein